MDELELARFACAGDDLEGIQAGQLAQGIAVREGTHAIHVVDRVIQVLRLHCDGRQEHLAEYGVVREEGGSRALLLNF